MSNLFKVSTTLGWMLLSSSSNIFPTSVCMCSISAVEYVKFFVLFVESFMHDIPGRAWLGRLCRIACRTIPIGPLRILLKYTVYDSGFAYNIMQLLRGIDHDLFTHSWSADSSPCAVNQFCFTISAHFYFLLKVSWRLQNFSQFFMFLFCCISVLIYSLTVLPRSGLSSSWW